MKYRLGFLLATAGLLAPVVAASHMGAMSISTSVIWIPTGSCVPTSPFPSPAPSTSPAVVVYTTTDSLGSTIITSSTSYPPTVSPSSTVILITTTDSRGSVITTSTTSIVPVSTPSASTTVIAITTTNSAGSTIITSTTSTLSASTPGTSTISSGPGIVTASGSPYPCPVANNSLYIDAQFKEYDVFCNTDFSYNDLPAVAVTSFAACIEACSNYVPSASGFGSQSCIAVTWSVNINPNGANCYLKSSITNIQYGNQLYDSAKLHSYNAPNPSISTESIGSASTAAPAASSSVVGIGSSTSTMSGAVSTSTSYPCPASIASVYQTSDGNVFVLFCATDFKYYDLPAVTTSSFSGCIAACAAYVPSASVFDGLPCVAVTWIGPNPNGANCYLKYAIQTVEYGNANCDSAKLVSYNVPPGISVSVLSSTATSSIGPSATTISSYLATSTGTISTTSSAVSGSTSLSASPCPQANGTVYAADITGTQYNILCEADYQYYDLTSVSTASFSACIQACDYYTPDPAVFGGDSCIAVTWVGENPNGNNCYLKYTIANLVYGRSRYCSAKRVDYTPSGPVVISVVSDPTISSTSFTTSSSTTSLSSTTLLSTTSVPSASPSVSPSGTTTSTVSSSASAAPSSSATCPVANGTPYLDSQNQPYNLYCGADFKFSDLSAVPVDSYEACLLACDNYVPLISVFGGQDCIAVTYIGLNPNGANCYLKYAITEVQYGANADSAARPGIAVPSPSSSSSTTSTSSFSSSTTSSSSTSSSVTTSTSSISSTSTLTSTSSSSTSSTLTSTSSSSTSSTLTSTSSSSILSTSSTSTLTQSGATSTPTNVPVCPGANNTQYTDPAGSTYDVKCGLDLNSTLAPISAVHADNYGACVEYCDIVGDCAGITWDGTITGDNRTNCFPLANFVNYFVISRLDLYSAVLTNGGTTSGNYVTDIALCPTYNSTSYTDPLGVQYFVGCNQTHAGEDLAPAQSESFVACLEYCDMYSACIAVDWQNLGWPLNVNQYNCIPKSSIGAAAYQEQTSYAVRSFNPIPRK
ncbi:hypothetical protein MMC24_004958 [Lignoscripta atroalba]|nr:hypothetical protein [Lignoscripta atroalba]